MTFAPPFARPFAPPFGGVAAAAVASWWLSGGIASANCIAAYQPVGAASLAASYINLANPGTYNAAPGSAPAWDATNGWKFNGTSHYLTTGIVPSYQTWSVIVEFTNATTNNCFMFGAFNAGGFSASFGISPRASVNTRVDYFSGGQGAVAPALSAGNLGFAGNLMYRNGTNEGTTIASKTGTSLAIIFGAVNSYLGALDYCASYIQAWAIYNTVLSGAQMLALYNAMAVLPL